MFNYGIAVPCHTQVNYIHVVEVTRENLCMVIGLPEVVKDFVEVHKGEMPTLYYALHSVCETFTYPCCSIGTAYLKAAQLYHS